MGRLRRPLTERAVEGRTVDEERLRVLKMVEDGRVPPDAGAKLLDALAERAVGRPVSAAAHREPQLRIHIASPGGEEANLAVPLPVAAAVLRSLPTWVWDHLEDEGLDRGTLEGLVTGAVEGTARRLLEMHGEETRIEILVE
jgi:hypothetical protein